MIALKKWDVSDLVTKTIIPAVGTHPYPLDELLFLAGAVEAVRPDYVFDWGTHIGKSALTFRLACNKWCPSAEVHTIDLPDDVPHCEHPGVHRGMFFKGVSGITQHLGDGAEIAFKLASAKSKPGKSIFFFDGDHSYSVVIRELALILPSDSWGAILLHDTHPTDGGPARAIADALKTYPNPVTVMRADSGLPGMTLVFRG